MRQLVGSQRELAEAVIADRFLPIDAFVDGAGRFAGVGGKNLGGAACGSEEEAYFLKFIIPRPGPEVVEGLDHRGYGGGLSRAGIAVDHQDVRVVTGHEACDLPEQPVLILCPVVREKVLEAPIEKVTPVHKRSYLFLRLKIIMTTARIG